MHVESCRRSDRVFWGVSVGLRVSSDKRQEDFNGSLLNISRHGAKIKTEHSLSPGEHLHVYKLGEMPPVRARIVWVREAESQPTEAGLEFMD
jgi:hypothetical protein